MSLEQNEKELNNALLASITDMKEKELRALRHDLKPDVIDKKGREYEKIVRSAREILGLGEDVSDEKVVERVLGTSNEVQEVMAGEFEGVFCDVEGTLLLGKNKINSGVVELLRKFKNEGKRIMFWTAGSPDLERKKIDRAVESSDDLDEADAVILLNLKVVSKYDFAGATVEITIDDMSEQSLREGLKLHSKQHIQV